MKITNQNPFLSCPFCGCSSRVGKFEVVSTEYIHPSFSPGGQSERKRPRVYSVYCDNCAMCGPFGFSEEDAMELWNHSKICEELRFARNAYQLLEHIVSKEFGESFGLKKTRKAE